MMDTVHTFTLQLTMDTRHSAGDEWYKETQDSPFECELSTHLLKFEHSIAVSKILAILPPV